MSGSPDEPDDYSDLGFDVEKHREATRVLRGYGFNRWVLIQRAPVAGLRRGRHLW
jgi:hypothetical protein